MLEPKQIDDFVRKLSELMPASVGQFQGEIEKNLKAGLQSTLQKMELVTREEYEVQAAVLGRTREKLEQLSQRLEQLEQKLK